MYSIIKNLIKVFIFVIAGTTIGSTIYMTLFARDAVIDYIFLWQIIEISGVCAFGNLIFHSKRELTKSEIKIRYIIHYIYNSIIVIGGAHLFNWINIKRIQDIVIMVVLVAIVYVSVTATMIKNDEKEAEDFNKKLSKYHKGEEEI